MNSGNVQALVSCDELLAGGVFVGDCMAFKVVSDGAKKLKRTSQQAGPSIFREVLRSPLGEDR